MMPYEYTYVCRYLGKIEISRSQLVSNIQPTCDNTPLIRNEFYRTTITKRHIDHGYLGVRNHVTWRDEQFGCG